MTEAELERRADQIVMRRLGTDRRYLDAEDAESQAEREQEIADQVWRDLTWKYGQPE